MFCVFLFSVKYWHMPDLTLKTSFQINYQVSHVGSKDVQHADTILFSKEKQKKKNCSHCNDKDLFFFCLFGFFHC